MNRLFSIAISVIVTLTLHSCKNKEERMIGKYDGLWTITSQTNTYYNASGGVDSTRVANNAGTLRLDEYEKEETGTCIYTPSAGVTLVPYFYQYLGASVTGIEWSINPPEYNRFVFSGYYGYQDVLAVYTVTEKKKDHIEMLIILNDANGNLAQKEVLMLDR